MFDIAVDRTPLDDIDGLVKYEVRDTVAQIVPDRLVQWTIGGVDQSPLGHVYGWTLDAVNDNETDVTNCCDWTNITPELRARRPDCPSSRSRRARPPTARSSAMAEPARIERAEMMALGAASSCERTDPLTAGE